ncbi:putative N6-adenine-specific DNA methylase [Clostridiaceae bacterium JG1575]|nr:putative N6-adenine-specific DNA methylase [Clostridiaceae bacterium JG1575]
MDFQLMATATFGLEALVAKELKELGYEDLRVENGRVHFSGDEMDIAIANTHLHCADRVLINMGQFRATTFEELFQGVYQLPWGALMPVNAFMHVNGKSVKSTLFSVPDCQSITKKAIIKAMERSHPGQSFPEDGPLFKIEVALLKDEATLSIDTTGPGLHKRGYRKDSGPAPLKETLASALVLLSPWRGQARLVDPFCGSGTILIEAARIARGIPPGLERSFACEAWPFMKREDPFPLVREGARRAIKSDGKLDLQGFDKDPWVLATARTNAKKAGVGRDIDFRQRNVRDFPKELVQGTIITNPPYGERLEEVQEAKELARILGGIRDANPHWDLHVFTALKGFESAFQEKAQKNRKLYNGRLLCYLYQYLEKTADQPQKGTHQS